MRLVLLLLSLVCCWFVYDFIWVVGLCCDCLFVYFVVCCFSLLFDLGLKLVGKVALVNLFGLLWLFTVLSLVCGVLLVLLFLP